MERFLSASTAFLLSSSALAQASDPPVESNLVGTVIFIVLFIGFCAGFTWMVWRDKDKDMKE